MKKLLPLIAALATATVLTACGGGGGDDLPLVATTNTTSNITASTVGALVNESFDFPAGVQSFGTATPTTVTVNSASTFSVASTEGSATGTLSFGSCIFTVTTSTYPPSNPLQVGRVIEVEPCTLNVPTAGVSTNGGDTDRTVTFTLGGTTSSGETVSVDVLDDGTVVVNGTNVGRASVQPTTGATGASGG